MKALLYVLPIVLFPLAGAVGNLLVLPLYPLLRTRLAGVTMFILAAVASLMGSFAQGWVAEWAEVPFSYWMLVAPALLGALLGVRGVDAAVGGLARSIGPESREIEIRTIIAQAGFVAGWIVVFLYLFIARPL